MRRSKRIASLLLAVCMVWGLLPQLRLPARAAEEHGSHTSWTQLKNSTSTINGGNYYLNSTVTANKSITVNGNVTLCLKGYTLDMGTNTLTVSNGATLTICDCQSGGTITGTESYSGLNVISVTGGTLNLESGTISGETEGDGSLISVTDGGALNVTGGTISLNHTGKVAQLGVQAVALSGNCTGSFTGGKVSLTTAVDNGRATTVYQEGGRVTVGDGAALSFKSENALTAPGYGALCVTKDGSVTLEDSCTITALREDGEMAGAVSIGKMKTSTEFEHGTATIKGGDITGALAVYGEADISGGRFDCIQNQGTLTMTGGTVENKNEYGINYGIWTNVTNGKTDLSDVSITAPIGVYVYQGQLTIREGVKITATEYGVDGINSNATLVDDPVIEGGTADLHICSMKVSLPYSSVDATQYTGGELTVQEQEFPDAHEGGYIGWAIEVKESDKDKFQFTNSDGNFVYQYDEANEALRLYNKNSHPICGAECSHGDASHEGAPWQKWSTSGGGTLDSGSYYLTDDMTLSNPITITGDVNFCLNGNTIKRSDGSSPFQVTEGGSLTICDCHTTGQLTGGITANSGKVGIYGGNISGGDYAAKLSGSATLILSGSLALFGNVAGIYLQDSAKIDPDGLDESVSISVSMKTPGVFTAGGGAAYIHNFTSANAGYDVIATADGELMLSSGFLVQFNVNGGDGTVLDQIVPDGGHAQVPDTAPTRTGYTLDGWYTEPIAGTKWDFETDEVKENRTLYAHWTANQYTVTFDKNADDAEGTMTAQPFTYDQSQNLTQNAFTRPGYTFAGWNTKANGSGTPYADQAAVKNLSATDGSSITLYAQWTLDTPAVTLEASQAGATYGETITLTAQVDHKISGLQYTYTWYKDGTLLSGETGKTLTLSDVADSGSYSVQVTITGDGDQKVTQTSGTKNITIAPRKAELEWNYTGPFSYTGNPCTVTAVVKNQVEGDTFTLTYSGNQGTDVGSYQAQVTGLGNPNYTLEGGTNTTLTWEIVKGQGEASVTMEDWIYGEEASQPSPDSSTHGTGGVTYHYTGRTAGNQDYSSDAVPTDAGDYTVTATFAANDNYNAITVQDAFTIAPRPVELSWSGEPSVVYDGQEHTVTAEVEKPVGEDVFHLEYSENQKTNAGSYQAEVTGLGNPNYTLEGGTNTTFAWEITKAPGEASVTMEDWTYGEEASQPSPTSGTNGTGSVTYRYTGRNETVYDSDALPTQVGEYTVTATFAPVENYEAAVATAEFSIGKKEIYATWQGLDQVYGDGTPVKIVLDGVVSGDQVSAQVDGAVPQNAGEHPLTAILTGEDAPNYIFKNDKATLTIQQKPVLFTVTDNAVQADGNAKEATVTPDESTFSGYTVEYRQEGQKVPSPSQVGTYEVWVTITDLNYRHTNGSDTMQVGDLTITQAPPTLYTVTFDGNEAEGSMTSLEAAADSTLILPVCAFSKTGYQFIGWTYDGQTYQLGDHFTMPNGDVTFKAQWEKVFRVDGKVTEETEGTDPQPVTGAVVSLWLGVNKLNETTTDSKGDYHFDNLTPGIYNLVVTKDVRTVTKKVEIKDQNAVCSAVLPKGATNSIVEVVPGSPDIVVGQLDTMFNSPGDAVYTQEDARTVEEGGKVEITFKAAEKQPEAAEISDDLEKIEKIGGSNLALVMDYTLEKTVTNVDGKTEKPVLITQANVLLEVRLPLPGELQGKQSYTVYRVHKEKAEALTTSPNALGEYFEVSSDKTVLILHVKCFSTYAIGYTEHSGNSGGGGGGGTPTYPPVVEQPEHGTVTISPDAPHKGDTVTITPQPEDGYQVDQVIVTDQNGKEVEVTPKEDGSYTFTQPDGKVTITVTFKEKSAVSHCPRDESCPMAPFTDADRTAWYHDGVHYCVEHGLMVGTSADTFEPNTTTTRGMIATILWRLEGSPMVDTAMNYTDVPLGSWYEEAIRWADSTGVVLGYGDGTFGPDDPITREQMAAMLWRYAGKPQAESSLADFTDGSETSQWAESAMLWAVEQGLIEGMGNAQLNPQGQATRAQAATILMRFVEKIGK